MYAPLHTALQNDSAETRKPGAGKEGCDVVANDAPSPGAWEKGRVGGREVVKELAWLRD